MKTINFCNKTFELYESKMHPVAPITGYNWDEIWEVYDKPSQAKQAIWHEWCEWVDFMETQGYEVGIEISSHSCMFFSISGSVRRDGKTWDIWITAAHNRAYARQ